MDFDHLVKLIISNYCIRRLPQAYIHWYYDPFVICGKAIYVVEQQYIDCLAAIWGSSICGVCKAHLSKPINLFFFLFFFVFHSFSHQYKLQFFLHDGSFSYHKGQHMGMVFAS